MGNLPFGRLDQLLFVSIDEIADGEEGRQGENENNNSHGVVELKEQLAEIVATEPESARQDEEGLAGQRNAHALKTSDEGYSPVAVRCDKLLEIFLQGRLHSIASRVVSNSN